MSIFSIFKKKKKVSKYDISKSIDGYFEKQNRFKQLKKSDLPSIPDSDLRTAVMNWMWNKFDEGWTNQYEVINSLPKPCQDVYSCCTVVDEINNGGFNQLFYNSTGQFAKMAQDGFIAIGNVKLSTIMKDAINAFSENKEALDKYNDGILESFLESYNENIFTQLDDDFFAEEASFNSLLENYIRKNEIVFGD